MTLDNDKIAEYVKQFVDIACAENSVREEMMIRAAGDLITNFLQNINDIAYVAICKEQRESSQ